jgi:aspartate kinase
VLVLKFGGTSMGSAQSINESVAPIVKQAFEQNKKPVVVVSAMTGTTNDLIAVVQKSIQSRETDLSLIKKIKDRHESVITTISDASLRLEVTSYLDSELAELANLIRALITIGEIPTKSFDAVLAIGEKLSAKLFSAILRSKGIDSVYCNFENIIPKELRYKDDNYWDKVADLLASEVKNAGNNVVPVATGFFGRSENGIIQDVGRGYSDYCASLLGAGLKSPEIQIWTDVDGVLSANPKVVPEAFINRNISFDEMAELATFGAKVLHPFSVRPAVNAGIPIRIVNTFNPTDPGTLVAKESELSTLPFKSIACKSGVSLIRISTPQMLLAHGFVAKLGQVLANHEVGIDLIATSEVSVSFSIEKGPENFDQLIADLSLLGEVNLTKDECIISLVGTELGQGHAALGRAITVLEKNEVPIHMLSMSNLRINLSIVTKNSCADEATRLLHREFFS